MPEYRIGEFSAYWAEMGDEAISQGEHQFLQGHVVEVRESDSDDLQIVVVRSAQTGRLWDITMNEIGTTVECTEHES